MRIAIFHELTLGGARRVANEFGKGLKGNHLVDLYYVGEKYYKEEEDFYSKIHFYKFMLKIWKGSNWKVRLYKDTIELLRLYLLHKKIADVIDKKNYDLVIVHPSKVTQAPFLLRFLKTKKIYYAHEIYRIMYEPVFRFRKSEYPFKYIYETITKFIKKVIDKNNTKKAGIIFVNSNHTKKGFSRFYNRKTIVCYPGVDYKFFSPKIVKRNIDILFVGSLDYQTDEYALFKNSIHFINKNVRIKVIGGEQNWISDKELLDYYRKSKIVVCTARNEPLGLVPLEAGSCGTPAIAVNDGGYKETIIKGKTGYLVRRHPKAIASVINRALKNEVILGKLGKNARERIINNWRWGTSVKRLESLLTYYFQNNSAP